MLAVDTETTGLDLYHEATPFLVTFCTEDLGNFHYEWEVNPRDRTVAVPTQDRDEIAQTLLDASLLVLHNAKFDVTGLLKILPEGFDWPWDKTVDTMIAGHLLASNHPHNLTSMVLEYLQIDVSPYESEMEKAVQHCRRLIRRKNSPLGDWVIAGKDVPGMPSAKEKTWKFDLWLPRAVLRYAHNRPELEIETEPEWEHRTAEYANSDSATTMALYQKLVPILQSRGLWAHYTERLKILRSVYIVERNGITIKKERLSDLTEQYRAESEVARRTCTTIAQTYDYELTLPKSGNNKSLTEFVFDVMRLPVIAKSKKTGAPSLDKNVLEEYETTLPYRSKQLRFIQAVRDKRKRDTALSYMASYDKFWIPTDAADWYRLHPSLNPVGTDTLRFSSSNPNEQNISKKEGFNLRYMFGPAPGREWWSLDFNNIELRIPAYESGEQELIALFEAPDEPPYYGSVHLLNFHTVYPDLWDKHKDQGDAVGLYCKKQYAASWYQYCKNGNFAVQYGSVEASGTADRAYHRPGSFAKIKRRFRNIHGPNGLNETMIAHAEQTGYVETMPDRTVDPQRGYPLLCTRGNNGSILPTVPLNYHTQGTACWVIARAMVKIQRYLDHLNTNKHGLEYLLIMQIHDEIVLDFPYVPRHGNLRIVRTIQKLLSSIGLDLVPSVPLPVGIDYHETYWSEGETIA